MTEKGEAVLFMRKWYVVSTRRGWEKKVERLLSENGFESYCPLKQEKRRWSDRVKTVAAPLFGSHIFVKITADQRRDVRMMPGVKNFVATNGKPATVKKTEVEDLRRLLSVSATVQLFPLNGSDVFLDEVQALAPQKKKKTPGGKVKKARIFLGEKGFEIRATLDGHRRPPVPNAMQ